MLRKKIMAGMTIVAVLLVPAPVFAHQETSEEKRDGLLGRVSETVETTVESTRDTTKSVVKEGVNTLQSGEMTQRERIDTRKQEIKQEISQKAEDKKQKLEGRRLAKCQNRQDAINKLIDTSATSTQSKLDRIQRFEDAIKKFYTDQSLTSESYESALADVEVKKAQAVAALEVMNDQEYKCDNVDGSNPSGEIKSLHDAKRNALGQYRDSVQNLLRVVKDAFTATKESIDE